MDTPTERLLAYPQDYLGLAEFAEVLGYSKQRLSNIRKRKPGWLPEPVVELALGPVWHKQQLYPWVAMYDSCLTGP